MRRSYTVFSKPCSSFCSLLRCFHLHPASLISKTVLSQKQAGAGGSCRLTAPHSSRGWRWHSNAAQAASGLPWGWLGCETAPQILCCSLLGYRKQMKRFFISPAVQCPAGCYQLLVSVLALLSLGRNSCLIPGGCLPHLASYYH